MTSRYNRGLGNVGSPWPPRSKSDADNYTDADLLAEMQLNPKLYNYAVNDIILKSARITFQISACVLFFVTYHQMKSGKLPPTPLIGVCWIFAFGGHMVFQLHKNWPLSGRLLGIIGLLGLLFPRERLRVTLFYLFASFALAPVLRTLTETISTDTVHAVSVGLLFAHLLTNDYGVNGFFVSKTISMNAAIIAAICLASRLSSDANCIGLITLAVLSFILFPMFATIIWDSVACLIVTVVVVAYVCFLVSIHVFLLYVGVITCVTVFTPLLFVTSQKFKKNLYGPWDEAVVEKSK